MMTISTRFMEACNIVTFLACNIVKRRRIEFDIIIFVMPFLVFSAVRRFSKKNFFHRSGV